MEKNGSLQSPQPLKPPKAEGREEAQEQVRRRFLVRGRVQGVFFRAWTQETATELGLHGMVRNLPDGGVEIVAGGPRGAMEIFEGRLWEGPPAARVEAVEATEVSEPLEEGSFRIVR